jgi:curved DNA-binding protein CbpA
VAETYYSLINVAPTASRDDILDVLRQENMKWSRRANNAPRAADRHEAEQRVELLAQIKAVMSDPASRAQYDASIGIRTPTFNPPPIDRGWPADPLTPRTTPASWPDPGPRSAPARGSGREVGGLLRSLFSPSWRGRGGGTSRTGRFKHPVWTVVLLIFALASFGSAGLLGSNGNSNDPVGQAIVGIIALVIAARVSGVWRRR